jgi:hypothetical protein
MTNEVNQKVRDSVTKVNENIQVAVVALKTLTEYTENETKMKRLDFEIGLVREMRRLTIENNERIHRYNAGKLFLAGFACGFTIATAGLSDLSLAPIRYCLSVMRWRKEERYIAQIKANVDELSILILMHKFKNAVASFKTSVDELNGELNKLLNPYDARRYFHWVALNCPVVLHYINDQIQNAAFNAADYFTVNYPETVNIMQAMLPTGAYDVNSIGVDAAMGSFSDGLQIFACVQVCCAMAQVNKDKMECENRLAIMNRTLDLFENFPDFLIMATTALKGWM